MKISGECKKILILVKRGRRGIASTCKCDGCGFDPTGVIIIIPRSG